MNTSFRFTGGTELAAALDALPRRVSRPIKTAALMDGGELIRKRAATLAPREPGAPDLAANLVIAPRRESATVETAVGIGPTSRAFFYDYFQEFGTVHHSAHPFYRPAFDSEGQRALGVIGQALWTALAGKGIGFAGSSNGPVSGGPGGSVL